jgi:hypothetical protein
MLIDLIPTSLPSLMATEMNSQTMMKKRRKQTFSLFWMRRPERWMP